MIQIITAYISDTERSTRLWMMVAFITRLIFTFVLMQIIIAMNRVSPGFQHRPFTPASSGENEDPASDIITDIQIYSV